MSSRVPVAEVLGRLWKRDRANVLFILFCVVVAFPYRPREGGMLLWGAITSVGLVALAFTGSAARLEILAERQTARREDAAAPPP